MKQFSKTEPGTLVGKSWACGTQVGDTGVEIFKDFDPLNCFDTLIACPQIHFLTKPGTPPHTLAAVMIDFDCQLGRLWNQLRDTPSE